MSAAAAPPSRSADWLASRKTTRARSRVGVSGVAVAAGVLLPVALVVGHAALFADWLIDDAGISFAYARNLALGHGLVSQPGAPPVEGFSNPLWTLLVAALQAGGLFDVAWTPKALSVALVALAFLAIRWDARSSGSPAWAPLLTTLLLALSTSFVVWTTSGLENPLLALLLALSCVVMRRSVEEPSAALDLSAGVLAGLAALTRPDAVLMAAAFPTSLALTAGSDRGSRERRSFARALRFAGGLAVSLGPYVVFRRWYFGDWLPNTYYAKDKPSPASLLDMVKAADLLSSLFGSLAVLVAAALVFEVARLRHTARSRPRHAVLLVHLGLALASYLLLPKDWMGEYRFATGVLLFLCWWVVELAAERAQDMGPTARVVIGLLLLALTADSAARHAARSAVFAQEPVTPFSHVAGFAGHGYNALAAALGPRSASLLAPDLGGALYYSRLRVYDLVGLCDREAARTLTHDTAAFHRYVFDEVRPTFIHVHGPWSGWAALHTSPVFSRDYVPLFEAWGDAFSRDESGREPSRGDYVRRDALSDPAGLSRLRRVFAERGLDRSRF